MATLRDSTRQLQWTRRAISVLVHFSCKSPSRKLAIAKGIGLFAVMRDADGTHSPETLGDANARPNTRPSPWGR